MKSVFSALSGLLFFALTTQAAADNAVAFAGQAVGSWSSIEQSADDAYDWVESEVVRIWPDREDGVWLYQENAIIGSGPGNPDTDDRKARPYFQVVVHVRNMGDGTLHTTTYRVADRQAARGAWKRPELFDRDWLGAVSCMGSMTRVGDGFWNGQTVCPNSYKGAVKLLSRSVRAPGVYVNWDRGFDADGRLIWGPKQGGYIFKRKEVER